MQTLSSRRVYANPWITVREDEVRRADGSASTYAVVDSADIALVIPTDGDRVHLVEQFRYPVGGRRREFPSGSAAESEVDLAHVAARELREETGLAASTLALLGTLEVTPSTMNQRCAVFLATDLAQGEAQREPAEQDMRAAWFTRGEV